MSQEQHAALSAERNALRARLGLRAIRAEEEGRNIGNQAAGVYGFTGAPASDEMPIFIQPFFRCTEVHRLSDGEVAMVGYVTDQERVAFEAGSEPASIHLYPDPWRDSNCLISVPLGRVDRRKPPARDEGNPMMVEVAPAS